MYSLCSFLETFHKKLSKIIKISIFFLTGPLKQFYSTSLTKFFQYSNSQYETVLKGIAESRYSNTIQAESNNHTNTPPLGLSLFRLGKEYTRHLHKHFREISKQINSSISKEKEKNFESFFLENMSKLFLASYNECIHEHFCAKQIL